MCTHCNLVLISSSIHFASYCGSTYSLESMNESGEHRRPFAVLQPPDELVCYVYPIAVVSLSDVSSSRFISVPRVQLLEVVSEEVCAQLVESCLPDLVRETVNSCIDEIVTRYIGNLVIPACGDVLCDCT